MNGNKDYYSVLGVDRGITQEDLKKTYKKLSKQYHPDKKGGNEEKFKEVGVRIVYFPYTKGTSSTLLNDTLKKLRIE